MFKNNVGASLGDPQVFGVMGQVRVLRDMRVVSSHCLMYTYAQGGSHQEMYERMYALAMPGTPASRL